MSTRNSSVAPSPVSSSGGLSWHTPKDTFRFASKPASIPNSTKPDRAQEVVDDDLKAKGDHDHTTSNEGLAQPNSQKTSATADSTPTCDPAFNFVDTNIQIRTGNRLFRIHQFKLSEFDRLRPKLEQATKDDKERKTIKLQDGADDFHNLLIVLYSSVYDFRLFTSAILKSTLKLATKYAHPTLRTFAIKELETHALEPVDRFALSRDCGVTEWMAKALDDLCWREESITVAEANILGPEKFVEVATRREGIKFERGSRVALGSGQVTRLIEAGPEPPKSGRPISQDLGGILIASNNLLATTLGGTQPISKKDSVSVARIPQTTSSQVSSDKSNGDAPNVKATASALDFAGLSSKPFMFSFVPKSASPETSARSPSQQPKDIEKDQKASSP